MAFMTHPKHGATYTNAVAEHEANGWQISTPEQWLGAKFEPVEVAPVRNKPGRKPKGQ